MRKQSVVTVAVVLAVCALLWLGVGCAVDSGTTSSTTASSGSTVATSATTASSEAPASTEAPTTTGAPTTEAVPTTVAAPDILPGVASKLYKNQSLGFSVSLPATAGTETSGFEQYLPLTQTPVVAIMLPETLFTGTNLGQAGVFIGASKSAEAIAGWDKPVKDSGETAAGTMDIGGVSFAVFTASEGAAGNIYESRIYRTLHGGYCIEIVEFLHSTQIGNYDPGTVKEFDKAAFQGYLEAIVTSFAFTKK